MKILIIIVLIFCFVIAFFEVKYFYLKVNSEINKVETRLGNLKKTLENIESERININNRLLDLIKQEIEINAKINLITPEIDKAIIEVLKDPIAEDRRTI